MNAPLARQQQQLLQLHLAGMTESDIAGRIGVSRQTVRNAVERGLALAPTSQPAARVGPSDHTGRALSVTQELALRRLVCVMSPHQLGLDFGVWSREALAMLIGRTAGVQLATRAVAGYQARWGFAPQAMALAPDMGVRPAGASTELLPLATLRMRARAHGAEIHRAGVVRVGAMASRGDGGEAPPPMQDEVDSMWMLSTIAAQGRRTWFVIPDVPTADDWLRFLGLLMRDGRRLGRKVMLVMDAAACQESPRLLDWLDAHRGEIELYLGVPANAET